MASVALGCMLTGEQGTGWIPTRPGNTFVEADYEIFSKVILSLPLIPEGHLSVSGKRMHTSIGYPLNRLNLLKKSVVR